MNINDQVVIRGPYRRVFELASQVEDWGEILPHYRYVKVLGRSGNRRRVRMSAWRDFIPVTWTAIQSVEPGSTERPGRITFHHVKGLVRGMDVEWYFRAGPERGEVVVGIAHHLQRAPLPTRLLGHRLVEIIVGRGFVSYIAQKTLRRIKELVEAEQ